MERQSFQNVLVNNKSAPLVLRSFQRILKNMKNEEEVLNDFEELHGQVHLRIRRLFADEGSEFKGPFASYCANNGIRLTIFKASEGSKTTLSNCGDVSIGH
jgi:hypothetical protein